MKIFDLEYAEKKILALSTSLVTHARIGQFRIFCWIETLFKRDRS